ncbi:MAG TPA: hypothetical protein VH186_33965 [Chloroflexia bacterium]|nr:hypothetical protein [Chloroflexia bacterium]
MPPLAVPRLIILVILALVVLALLTLIQAIFIPETDLLQLVGGGLVLTAVTYLVVELALSGGGNSGPK